MWWDQIYVQQKYDKNIKQYVCIVEVTELFLLHIHVNSLCLLALLTKMLYSLSRIWSFTMLTSLEKLKNLTCRVFSLFCGYHVLFGAANRHPVEAVISLKLVKHSWFCKVQQLYWVALGQPNESSVVQRSEFSVEDFVFVKCPGCGRNIHGGSWSQQMWL